MVTVAFKRHRNILLASNNSLKLRGNPKSISVERDRLKKKESPKKK
jgi:hypothetical protein